MGKLSQTVSAQKGCVTPSGQVAKAEMDVQASSRRQITHIMLRKMLRSSSNISHNYL